MALTSKASKILIVIIIVGALSLTASTLAVITVNQNLNSVGAVITTPNIGVYSNNGCTKNMTTIDWGSLTAGSNTTQTIYVKNTGTGSMTLGMETSSWNPTTASNYISVTWDKQNTILSAGQSTAATLTLSVAPNIAGITNYSNTITISGTA
jgi:hypothetical protein